MGILSTFRSMMIRRYIVIPGQRVLSVADMDAEELYATQPHLRTVISFLADNVAQLPLKCYIREDDDDRTRDTTGVAPMLLAHPNSDQTGYELICQTISEFLLYGESIWCIEPSSSSPSGWQIRCIPPSWIVGRESSNSFSLDAIYVVAHDGGPSVRIDRSQLCIFRAWNPSDPRATSSPVEALIDVLSEQVSAWKFRRQVWDRGGRFSEYISRPKDVEGWTSEQLEKFRKGFAEAWTGNNGGKAGGVPVLEDGMEVKSVTFNAREAQWLEASKLSLETCAAVYHLNPVAVGSTEGQTYASVKEASRQLYSDTLGPILKMVSDRITQFALPMIGAPASEYAEFDIQAKLAGSFEEEAAAIQTATGAPWMTRAEARARKNLPYIDGTDDLIVPLNVIEGGQASPTDTQPTGYEAGAPQVKSAETHVARKSRGKATVEGAQALSDVVRKFARRQRNAVLPAIGAKSGESPEWWDGKRWDKELADDLYPAMLKYAAERGRYACEQLGIDPMLYSEEATQAYLRKWAENRAKGINSVTLADLEAAIAGSLSDDAAGSTPAGVFDKAETSRADTQGATLAVQVAGWSGIETVRQCAPNSGATKTWIHSASRNPRSAHAAMDGETVPWDAHFSNGASFPGDGSAGGADEWAHCRCEVEVTIL